jgi:RNA polymerase sigma factor (sigma-70 family)
MRRELDRLHKEMIRERSRRSGAERLASVADRGKTPSALAEEADQRRRLLEAIESLAPHARLIVKGSLAGITMTDMARVIGVSVSTVSRQLQAALDQLADALQR